MNIAQRNQLKIKQRLAKGEKVVAPTPIYAGISQSLGGNAATNHQQKVRTAQQKQKINVLDSVENKTMNQEYDIIKASLEGDLITLKGLKTKLKKLEYKAHIIPNYLDYLKKYQESEHDHPNAILSQVVVWLFDCEQFELAFKYVTLAMQQGQKLPVRFTTPNFETFICDELSDYAIRQLKAEQPAPYIEFAIQGIQSGWDVNAIVKGKVFAMAGKLEMAAKNELGAHGYWTQALAFNDRAGVIKVLRDLTAKMAQEAK